MYDLSKEEIETPRSPQEHIDWTLSTLNKYITSDERIYARYKSTKELKVFFGESYPLLKLCEYYFDDDVILKQIDGNQSHDVVVENSNEIDFIEITQAINGYGEKLRMTKLNENGRVSASNAIDARRRNKITEIELSYDAPEGMEEVEEKPLTELIETIVRKKVAIDYPDKTLLLIAFDNAVQSDIGIDMSDLDDFMRETIAPIIDGHFAKVVLIGLSKDYHCEI